MNRPRIGLDRSIELSFRDPDWQAWIESNGIVDMLCFHLIPLNEALTVWEADCYVKDTDGRVQLVTEAGAWPPTLATETQVIETTPGRVEWLERSAR